MKPALLFVFCTSCLTTVLLTVLAAPIAAQKLPDSQKQSQWLPSEAKADGKLTEWEGKLVAYNKATRLSYLMANDDTRIYLALKSVDVGTTAKIMAGGITLTLNISGEKKGNGPSLTFPLTNSGYTVHPDGKVSREFPVLTDSVPINAAIRDFGQLKLLGFTGITDSIQSIYNELEIRAKMSYARGTFVYELIIPRSALGLSERTGSFAYQIKLNGVQYPNSAIPPPPATLIVGRKRSDPSNIWSEIGAPTYFLERYQLLKHQP